MPNTLDTNGLTIKTLNEIVSDLTTGMQGIYGSDINIDQNSPDGQLINIYAQTAIDTLELLLNIYNSYSIANSYGVNLDQRVALNGITRNQGTYTRTNITIVTDRPISAQYLLGLDFVPAEKCYTVADANGNKFVLETTQSFWSAGTYVCSFRAYNIGMIQTTINTITNPITVVLGITSVNNPTAALYTGINEETDVELKVRQAKMFYLAATSPADSIESALLQTTNVTDAFVPENDTSIIQNGINPHSIWAIIENGSDADIAQAIYIKKAPGCGMQGSSSSTILRPNGTTFTALFDRPLYQNLHIRFGMIPKDGVSIFDNNYIKQSLVSYFNFKLNQTPTIGDIVVAMQTIQPEAILTSIAVSKDGSTWLDIVYPDTYQYKFQLNTSNITIL